MTYVREDQAQITVALDGVPKRPAISAVGSWATYSGGELEADDSKTRPGGMGREESAGGPSSRGDVTLTTQLTDLDWHFINEFEARNGTGQVDIGVTRMTPEKTVDPTKSFGRTGTLKSVATPDFDVNGNEVTFLSIVVSCDE